ncbi:nuclear transport factor 2 family protein [Pseudohalioglobus sediminis]|nr:nuclear transport factor 2 family protein [Pseudohalioglobus sediminis]
MHLHRTLTLLACLLPNLLMASEVDIAAALDRFHAAATAADEDAYLAEVTDNMVFLGTDASERWQGQAWRDFVHQHFSEGQGWEYRLQRRHITLSADGASAWFDELLDNDQLGLCRGSGVLVKDASGWKISQYNLSMPVPNEMILGVARDIASDTSTPAGEPSAHFTEEAKEAEETEEEAGKRCPKRHKTNRRANC